jgi:hypothetical protein
MTIQELGTGLVWVAIGYRLLDTCLRHTRRAFFHWTIWGTWEDFLSLHFSSIRRAGVSIFWAAIGDRLLDTMPPASLGELLFVYVWHHSESFYSCMFGGTRKAFIRVRLAALGELSVQHNFGNFRALASLLIWGRLGAFFSGWSGLELSV